MQMSVSFKLMQTEKNMNSLHFLTEKTEISGKIS